MAYQDIDFTYFPDSVTEIDDIRDRLRATLSNIEAKTNSFLRDNNDEAYSRYRRDTDELRSNIHSYTDHLLRCTTFLLHFPYICTNICHDPKTIPFFNRKMEYMKTHDILWQFLNPNGAPLTYELHHHSKLCEHTKYMIHQNDNAQLAQIDSDWERGEPYLVEWLNNQFQTEFEDFPEYVFISVLVYVFQLPKDDPEEPEPEEHEEEEDEEESKIIYEIDEQTFELQMPSSSSTDSSTPSEIIFKIDIRTRLPTQLLSLIFCYLDYTEYYHDRTALCAMMGFPQDEFMRLWLSCSRHETLTKVCNTVMRPNSGTYMDTYYYVNGKLHRENDEPAMIMSDGSIEYRICGERHREGDKPARITAKGSELYAIKGALHRDFDKPAIIRKRPNPTGEKVIWKCEWYQNGFQHRDGDKPAFIENDGTQKWYRFGQSHREGDKPAITTPKYDHYMKHDFTHRANDKPAFIEHDGSLTEYIEYGGFHRIQGPAFIEPTRHMYYQQGKQHRLDGPAFVDLNNSLNNEMCIHGNSDMVH